MAVGVVPIAKSDERKKASSSAPYASGTFQRALRPKTAAEAEAMLAARATDESSADPNDVSPDLFGARLLKDDSDIWDHNAWDHVVPPAEHYEAVAETLARQAETKLSLEEAESFHSKPAGYWDVFYSSHENRFFKDRKWLHLEFPELVEATQADAGAKTVLEVGCGAGNTVFPLLEINQNPHLRIHACDYSAEAVGVVRSNPLYTAQPGVAKCVSTVWDLSSSTELPAGLESGSVDIIVLIFVLSALHPREWQQAVQNIKTLLKPKTGIVLFRDYGRYDLPQLRFKKRRMLQDNFYLRGDGTRVYFFEPEELIETIFQATPPPNSATIEPSCDTDVDHADNKIAVKSAQAPDFETLQMAIDRRLIVNRKERKRMYRVWLQAKFRMI